jgi:serine/threonine protein kinase
MTSGDATTIASGARSPSSDSGWLSSSGSIDHGRFAPGTILDNRYRVLGLLGRGGMGEVYRADDLRLGQPVALKFLPGSLSRDPGRLAQFHNEVRTARQVSHANVCRVYDVGEIDGQLFITMEYVDGEDLSGLLRRIGRLPEDKGIEISRQICAGLAAAHERGILHRDLKPANIMLDGSGKVRIMDFGLAAVGEVTDIRAGTPAYMAPEQLSGQEVTVRSDIYALGLVLYEIFTGRRAYEAKTLADLIEQHRSGALTAPTSIVKSLDPAIESALVRCLDPIPVRRPSSAIAVSAALPGGDPLAAALAAGETPSPEMVAAAGGDQAMLSLPAGIAWLTVAATAVIAAAALSAKLSVLPKIPLSKPAPVLADRSEEIRTAFGYADTPADQASGFYYESDYFSWAASHGGTNHWSELSTGRPPVVRFWYRTSPVTLVPVNSLGSVSPTDPPLLLHGMVKMTVDTKGRLLRFEAAPPQIENVGETAPPFDWRKAFAAAGIDPSSFTDAPPSRTPATYADERRAWKGTLPETNIPIAIEAAAYRGRPVLFDIVLPWVKPSREPEALSSNSEWILISVLLAAAAVAAWGNLRRGRADRRGAFRLAAFMTLLLSAYWAVSPHVPAGFEEQQRFFARVGIALFIGAVMYLVYLGLEPFVRRLWPTMLVGWSRVLSGRVRDPMVGRDAMVGVACGATLALLGLLPKLLPPLLGHPSPPPRLPELGAVMGARGAIATLLGSVNNGFQNALLTVFEFSFLRALFEWVTRTPMGSARWTLGETLRMSDRVSEKVFIALVALIMTAMELRGVARIDIPVAAASQAASTLLILVVLLRVGILSSVVMFSVSALLLRMPMTFDARSLYAGAAWFALAAVFALGIAGFRLATRDQQAARAFV